MKFSPTHIGFFVWPYSIFYVKELLNHTNFIVFMTIFKKVPSDIILICLALKRFYGSFTYSCNFVLPNQTLHYIINY